MAPDVNNMLCRNGSSKAGAAVQEMGTIKSVSAF